MEMGVGWLPVLCRRPLVLSFSFGIYLIFTRLPAPFIPNSWSLPDTCPPCVPCLEKRTASPQSQPSRWELRSSGLLLSPLLHAGLPSSVKLTCKVHRRISACSWSFLSQAPGTFSWFSHVPQLSSKTESHNSSPLPWYPQPHFWLRTPRLVL